MLLGSFFRVSFRGTVNVKVLEEEDKKGRSSEVLSCHVTPENGATNLEETATLERSVTRL